MMTKDDQPPGRTPSPARSSPRYITDEERGRRLRQAAELAEEGLDPATIAERIGLTLRQVEEYLRYREKQNQRQSRLP